MLFAKMSFEASPADLLRRLADLVCGCAQPDGATAREWLAFAGQIEQAVDDALYAGDLVIDEEAARRAGISFRYAGDFFA